MRRAQHRSEVAAKLTRVSDVQRQQIEQILARPTGLVKPDRRDAYPLLPDFGRGGVVGAMRRTADIALMGADDGPEQALLAIENWHEDRQVRQMAAAMIGIVEQDHVARANVAKAFLDRQRRPRQRADMHRKM